VTTRVLLVDDVLAVRRLVRTALRFRGGFEVVGEAGDGQEAARLAQELRPDVVVLDLGLPDLAGRDVLTHIRAGSPGARIVVFSGADPEADEWIAQNVEGFVLKDEELDYLVDLLVSIGEQSEASDPFREHVSIRLPHELLSAGEARRFAAQVVVDWQFDTVLDDTLLVVSELAANALTHADSALELRMSHSSNILRVEVTDDGAGTPEPQPESTTEEHGRGLHLVDHLTTAWGMRETPGAGKGAGKMVWAELTRPGPPPSPAQSADTTPGSLG
jgi:DNA-binding NarL/FixJ family response regulator